MHVECPGALQHCALACPDAERRVMTIVMPMAKLRVRRCATLRDQRVARCTLSGFFVAMPRHVTAAPTACHGMPRHLPRLPGQAARQAPQQPSRRGKLRALWQDNNHGEAGGKPRGGRW